MQQRQQVRFRIVEYNEGFWIHIEQSGQGDVTALSLGMIGLEVRDTLTFAEGQELVKRINASIAAMTYQPLDPPNFYPPEDGSLPN